MESVEGFAATDILHLRDPLVLDGFRKHADHGASRAGTVPKKIKQPASKLYETVNSLKVITRMVKYARVKETDSGPSCSLAEALEKTGPVY